jgi:hypothetical protein
MDFGASFTMFSATCKETSNYKWVIRIIMGVLEVGGMSLKSEHLVVTLVSNK